MGVGEVIMARKVRPAKNPSIGTADRDGGYSELSKDAGKMNDRVQACWAMWGLRSIAYYRNPEQVRTEQERCRARIPRCNKTFF